MKTPIRIAIVSDFGCGNQDTGLLTFSRQSELDSLIKMAKPVIDVPDIGKISILSMDDFSVDNLKSLPDVGDNNELVTKILHNSLFQSIEAAWRGVALLASKLPEQGVVIDLLHAPTTDVRQRVHQHIMLPEYNGTSEVPCAALLANYDFTYKSESLDVLIDLARMAEAIRVPVVTQTTAEFFGIKHLLHLSAIKNPMERLNGAAYRKYLDFRKTETSFWVSLMVNQFLLRSPYANEDYQEPASARLPEQYLWGRGIWLLGSNLIESVSTREHMLGLAGLGTGGEESGLCYRELPLSRTETVKTPLEAPLTIDTVEALPYFGISPLSQLPDEMGGQQQPDMAYVHMAANLHHIEDPDENKYALLTVHTSLAYSMTIGHVSHLAARFVQQKSTQELSLQDLASQLLSVLIENLWHKEEDEIAVTAQDGALHIKYRPSLVIHTRSFEILLDIPIS